jgi:tetratricopeptide (TPR) repeat protein
VSGIAHRAYRTSFVGRQAELDAIADWYEAPGSWLLTLLGPPGAGKTRLAHESLGALGVPAHGVLWVDLSDAEDVASRVARALGLPRSDPRTLARALRAATDLVVLDECESAISEVAAELVVLGETVPALRFLATSRRAIAIAGERTIHLDRFGVPARDVPIEASPAGRLFLDRARQSRPGFSISPADEPHVRAILERVGELPLAVELVTSQVIELGARPIAERLERPLDVLVGDRRDDPRGPLTVALEHSFAALDAGRKNAIALLSALDRPFDLDDAEVLFGSAAIETLSALRASSWIARTSDALYDLLPPIRHFVAREGAIDDAGRARLDEAWLRGAARSKSAPLDPLIAAVRRRIGDEPSLAIDAIAGAYTAFASSGCLSTLADLSRELARDERGPRVALLRSALRALIELGRFDESEPVLAELGAIAEGEADARLALDVRLARARIDFRTGRYDRLRELDVPVHDVPPEDVEVLATAASIRGETDFAVSLYERALSRRGGSERTVLRAMLARLLAETGAADRALEELDRADAEASGDLRIAASIGCTRALVEHDRGRFGDALAAYDVAIARYASMGNVLAAYVRFVRAIAALEDRRFDEARSSFLAALEDTPPDMVQLAPLAELARFVARGIAPAGADPVVPVVAASTALVRAYVERCVRGESPALDAALRDNEPHARWSVTSRVLSRLANTGPLVRPRAVASPALLVGPGGSWFAVVGTPQVSLVTRPLLARVLTCLVELREREPTGFASFDDIAERAWPSERMLERAKRSRVHVAISTLRSLGLRDHLARSPSGYRLELPIERRS